MAVLHRALFTWFICLMFLILLVLRLDERVRWSWFIVLIPLWLYDSILLIYLVFSIISNCRNHHDRFLPTMRRKIWYILAIVLKLAAQVMLCIRLEDNGVKLSLLYVMIPVWIILPIATADVFISLFDSSN